MYLMIRSTTQYASSRKAITECATVAEIRIHWPPQTFLDSESVLAAMAVAVLTSFCICDVLAAIIPRTAPSNISLAFAVQQPECFVQYGIALLRSTSPSIGQTSALRTSPLLVL
jgi:hypothetical protein